MKFLASIIFVSIISAVFVFVMNISLDRMEKVECLKLAQQAKDYPNFYYTDYQAKQCLN